MPPAVSSRSESTPSRSICHRTCCSGTPTASSLRYAVAPPDPPSSAPGWSGATGDGRYGGGRGRRRRTVGRERAHLFLLRRRRLLRLAPLPLCLPAHCGRRRVCARAHTRVCQCKTWRSRRGPRVAAHRSRPGPESGCPLQRPDPRTVVGRARPGVRSGGRWCQPGARRRRRTAHRAGRLCALFRRGHVGFGDAPVLDHEQGAVHQAESPPLQRRFRRGLALTPVQGRDVSRVGELPHPWLGWREPEARRHGQCPDVGGAGPGHARCPHQSPGARPAPRTTR